MWKRAARRAIIDGTDTLREAAERPGRTAVPDEYFSSFGPSPSSQRPLRARGPVDPRAAKYPPRFADRNVGGATDVEGHDIDDSDVHDPEMVPPQSVAGAAVAASNDELIDFEAIEVEEVEEVEVLEMEVVEEVEVDGGPPPPPAAPPHASPTPNPATTAPRPPDVLDALDVLAQWAEPRAGGLWPIAHRIELTSTSSGGWRLTVPLTGTPLADRHCRGGLVQRSATDRLRFGVHQGVFVGVGGPLNLSELVRSFTDFATRKDRGG